MAEFEYDPSFERAIVREAQMGAFLGEKAEAGVQEARAIAPVASGEFRDSIHPEVVLGPDGYEGRIVSDDPKWFWLEYGTSRTPTFATLRRALDAL